MSWPVPSAVGQEQGQYDYRLLAAIRTSAIQKEVDAAAADGFRFAAITSGSNAVGGLVVVMQKNRGGGMQGPRYQYKVLATTRASTMRKELRQESEAGFALVGMTAATEIVVILERRAD